KRILAGALKVSELAQKINSSDGDMRSALSSLEQAGLVLPVDAAPDQRYIVSPLGYCSAADSPQRAKQVTGAADAAMALVPIVNAGLRAKWRHGTRAQQLGSGKMPK